MTLKYLLETGMKEFDLFFGRVKKRYHNSKISTLLFLRKEISNLFMLWNY